jgi:hypothetical protein
MFHNDALWNLLFCFFMKLIASWKLALQFRANSLFVKTGYKHVIALWYYYLLVIKENLIISTWLDHDMKLISYRNQQISALKKKVCQLWIGILTDKVNVIWQFSVSIFMPPFEEEGVYCFAHVGWSVCRSVCRSVHQVVVRW